MSDAHDARIVGEPLLVNPEAVRAALDGVAADAARFRRRPARGGDADVDAAARGQEGQSGLEPPLNWGPEGEEGPLLSIGEALLITLAAHGCVTQDTCGFAWAGAPSKVE